MRNHKMKVCPKCKIKKIREDFPRDRRCPDGRSSVCKKCNYSASKKWAQNNRQKRQEGSRNWRKNNPEKATASVIKWQKNNPEKVKAYKKTGYERQYGTPRGKLNICISSAIRKSLYGNKSGRHWESLVEYTLDQLTAHLEAQFLPGMAWKNYGKWHIDHRIPISAFNFEAPEDIDFKQCWALRNLRPLWAVDNIRKFNKLKRPFQPSLCLSLGGSVC